MVAVLEEGRREGRREQALELELGWLVLVWELELELGRLVLVLVLVLVRELVLRSGGLKVRLAQVDYVGEFKGKGDGRVFGNDQRQLRGFEGDKGMKQFKNVGLKTKSSLGLDCC